MDSTEQKLDRGEQPLPPVPTYAEGAENRSNISGPAHIAQHSSPYEASHAADAIPPPQPPRPEQVDYSLSDRQQPSLQTGHPAEESMCENAPALPPRSSDIPATSQSNQHEYVPPPPPRRQAQGFDNDDLGNPIHFTRDPHKLIAYLVPFPQPQLKGVDPRTVPARFLIYTPPPPPLAKPAEGDKESKLAKVQRKWQEEVRSAKTSTAKTASWQGVKSKATRGINKAMSYTTTSNLDFLGRVSGQKSDSEDGKEEDSTHKTIGVDEMILIYPPTMNMDQLQMREEFVNTMLRAKSKAQRDAIISTGLLPVAFGIDILATLVWPFGGLGEIDTVWAYANIRGAKTARSVTKRLSSQSSTGDHEQDTLQLNFLSSERIELLRQYLAAECHKIDAKNFPGYHTSPTESTVLEAIGWSPKHSGGESKNWEDEQWEMSEVKEDLKTVMHKGAKEWNKWCIAYEKDPQKAMKK